MSAAAARALAVPHVAAPAVPARRQWVKYPWRIVADSTSYAPTDTNVYGKVAALAQRGLATASMEKIAGYLGVSKSTAERSARRLGNPAPTDGITELHARRRTHEVTGTGRTAERWCRPLDPREHYVWAPVLAADTLRGPLHRLYLALRYHQDRATGHQPTLAELGALLRHHGGRRAGQPLGNDSVSDLLDELETLGWITLSRRAGYRGRHLVTVHDHPVHPAEPATEHAAPAEPTPGVGDGSGGDLGDGSLAYKEDQQTHDAEKTPAASPLRRRRGSGSGRAAPVENRAGSQQRQAPPGVVPVSLRGEHNPTPQPAYTGPALTVSPRIWHVLEPVQRLYATCTPYVQRQIAREIGRQLDAGTAPGRLRDRLQTRYGRTGPREIRDGGRWLLGAALPRWGCGLDDCETGVLWSSGLRCQVCAERLTVPPQQPPTAPPAPTPKPARRKRPTPPDTAAAPVRPATAPELGTATPAAATAGCAEHPASPVDPDTGAGCWHCAIRRRRDRLPTTRRTRPRRSA